MMFTTVVPILMIAFQAASVTSEPPDPIAMRATHPPVIDGRADDEVWQSAQRLTEFREFQPREDGDPRFATEARVAYDARNFYVFVRMFDSHPDSILTLMARRDVHTPSDQIKIIIDSYHDKRTGYEFAVNPAGVKRDYAVYSVGTALVEPATVHGVLNNTAFVEGNP